MAYDPLLTVDGGEAADDNPAETTPAVGQQAVRAKPVINLITDPFALQPHG